MRITGGSVFDLEHGFCEKDLCTDGSVFAGTKLWMPLAAM